MFCTPINRARSHESIGCVGPGWCEQREGTAGTSLCCMFLSERLFPTPSTVPAVDSIRCFTPCGDDKYKR